MSAETSASKGRVVKLSFDPAHLGVQLPAGHLADITWTDYNLAATLLGIDADSVKQGAELLGDFAAAYDQGNGEYSMGFADLAIQMVVGLLSAGNLTLSVPANPTDTEVTFAFCRLVGDVRRRLMYASALMTWLPTNEDYLEMPPEMRSISLTLGMGTPPTDPPAAPPTE